MTIRKFSLRSSSLGGICAAFVVGVVSVSCGVQTGSGSFERIADDDVPNRLADPTTTSTSTTTTTSIAIDPPVSTAVPVESVARLETVNIYFVLRDKLRSRPVELPVSNDVSEKIDVLRVLLEAGPTGDSAGLFDSEVGDGLLKEFSLERDVLTIDLDEATFQEVRTPQNQREAIAQIVLTFLNNLVGVGNVQFTMGGDVLTVPTGNGIVTDEPVARADYESMLAVVGAPDPDVSDTTPSDSQSTTSLDTTEP